MIEAFTQSYLSEQLTRMSLERIRRRRPRAHQRRHENVFEHGALRQQAMVLKDESNLRVAELGNRLRRQLKRILTVERDGALRRRFERAEHVEQ